MKNHYHKVAVASVCTALGFVLGTEEAYSATFSNYYPYPLITFQVIDGDSFGSFDGLGDRVTDLAYPNVDSGNLHSWYEVEKTTAREIAALTEFSIPGLTWTSTGYRTDTRITSITRAILRVELLSAPTADSGSEPRDLGIFGYVGNGTAEASDFEAGVFLDSTDISEYGRQYAYFNVTPFVSELVSNNNEFAGFALRSLKQNSIILNTNYGKVPPTLIVNGEFEIVESEPVPEPTAIFGSAIALGLGGWLKRKKSSQPHKTTPQG
ncbi:MULTISPECIES: PEP-CTERM sorting domain-containing protein [unclassified Microcoleus]|uniref:PEP-CTERM sorting domain-containing protein n=1 Tax=unclassified Microcoleus TaxID=2642155 RepID=UPI002FD56A41